MQVQVSLRGGLANKESGKISAGVIKNLNTAKLEEPLATIFHSEGQSSEWTYHGYLVDMTGILIHP
jgi:hypothetical protein